MKSFRMLLLALFSLAWFSSAQAGPVPADKIVLAGGMEWAWASPCAPSAPSCGGDVQLFDGWAIATAADFASSFTGFEDLSLQFDRGAICASAYFGSGFSHCDNGNVQPSFNNVRVWNAPAAWGANSPDAFSETFVVRNGVPEPGALALVGLALAGLALSRRRASTTA